MIWREENGPKDTKVSIEKSCGDPSYSLDVSLTDLQLSPGSWSYMGTRWEYKRLRDDVKRVIMVFCK